MTENFEELIAYAKEKLELNTRDAEYKTNRILEIMQSGLEGAELEDAVYGELSLLPSEIDKRFAEILKEKGSKAATEWLYNYCVNNKYVKKDVLDKNPRFDTSNGLVITINKAKPEFRDPKKAKAGNSVDGGFAKCVICRENEGFAPRNKRNLRTVSISLGSQPWFWQYSPYGYFHEHGIAVNCEHIHFHANIRKALQDAYKNDIIPCNYADKAHRPKKGEFTSNYYNRDELLILFDAVKGLRIEFPVLMAGYYGMRRGEIVGLKWSNIDFEYGTITIKHTVSYVTLDGKTVLVAKDRAKTKKSIRTLPLVPPVREMLIKMKDMEEANKRFFGSDYYYGDDDYVYKNEMGKLISPDYVTQNFAIQVKKIKSLEQIRFHDLRHSCAALLRHEGVPMEDIQKWLGHSQITTTESIYAHFEDKTHLKSAQKILNAFNGI